MYLDEMKTNQLIINAMIDYNRLAKMEYEANKVLPFKREPITDSITLDTYVICKCIDSLRVSIDTLQENLLNDARE